MYTDTHAHLTDETFSVALDATADRWRSAGVGLVVNIGYDIKSSKESAFIAQKLHDVYFCAGLHPSDGDDATDENLQIIRTLAANEKCVGIGEIGLDYHYGEDRLVQMQRFVAQMELASELGMPVSIHARDCTADMLTVVGKYKDRVPAIILHCYSMGAESAKIFNKYGCYFALGGAATFKNNRQIHEVVREVPLGRLLTETDCPYMTPVPFRGKPNAPEYVGLVCDFLAGLYGLESGEMQDILLKNTLEVFPKIKL